MSLGPECCTYLMCLVHLLWIEIAAQKHAQLFPVAAKVCPCLGVANSSSCILHVSLIVTKSQCLFQLTKLLDELVDHVLLHFDNQCVGLLLNLREACVARVQWEFSGY